MSKRDVLPPQAQDWVDARRRHGLSHAHVQMASELGLNPAKLGKLDNHRQEPLEDAPVHRVPVRQKVRPAAVRGCRVHGETCTAGPAQQHQTEGPAGCGAPSIRGGGFGSVSTHYESWPWDRALDSGRFDDLRALSTGAHSAAARIDAGNVIIELTQR